MFIVIDQPFGTYPKDFAAWSADAVICDPWAKIACGAVEYVQRWKEKMDQWDRVDKAVGVAGLGWGSPLRPSVYEAPIICEKKPYTCDEG